MSHFSSTTLSLLPSKVSIHLSPDTNRPLDSSQSIPLHPSATYLARLRPVHTLLCRGVARARYVKHNVFWRLKKTVDIMVGANSMRKYPSAWEKEDDLVPLDGDARGAALQ